LVSGTKSLYLVWSFDTLFPHSTNYHLCSLPAVFFYEADWPFKRWKSELVDPLMIPAVEHRLGQDFGKSDDNGPSFYCFEHLSMKPLGLSPVNRFL